MHEFLDRLVFNHLSDNNDVDRIVDVKCDRTISLLTSKYFLTYFEFGVFSFDKFSDILETFVRNSILNYVFKQRQICFKPLRFWSNFKAVAGIRGKVAIYDHVPKAKCSYCYYKRPLYILRGCSPARQVNEVKANQFSVPWLIRRR